MRKKPSSSRPRRAMRRRTPMVDLVARALTMSRSGELVLLESGARMLDFELSLLKRTEALRPAIATLRMAADALRRQSMARAAGRIDRLILNHLESRIALGDAAATEAYELTNDEENQTLHLTGEVKITRAPKFASRAPMGSLRLHQVHMPTRF